MIAHANNTPWRSWNRHSKSRFETIVGVLKAQGSSQEQIWHDSNIALGTLNLIPLSVVGAAALGVSAAAEATVVTTVSAGGIAGWFGATTTILAPAAYAGIASICAPIAAVGTGIAGVAYLSNKNDWKRKTLFNNPIVKGFPTGRYPTITIKECSFPDPTEAKMKWVSSGSTSPASTSVVGLRSTTLTSTPPIIGVVGASTLYKMASIVIVV